jgi:tripartite-type tricarboxylate transporter receptor subunit TctC
MVALGVSSASRWPGLPQVPSLGEHPLLKGFDLSGWFALAGPRNMPSGVAEHLRAEMQAGLQDPAVRRRLQENGALPATGTEDMARLIDQDVARYAALVKFANIRE